MEFSWEYYTSIVIRNLNEEEDFIITILHSKFEDLCKDYKCIYLVENV